LVRVTSSGSTGAPVDVYRDGLDQRYMWACVRFWLCWAGIALGPRPRAAMLCTLPGGLAYSRRAPLFFGGALHRISTRCASMNRWATRGVRVEEGAREDEDFSSSPGDAEAWRRLARV